MKLNYKKHIKFQLVLEYLGSRRDFVGNEASEKVGKSPLDFEWAGMDENLDFGWADKDEKNSLDFGWAGTDKNSHLSFGWDEKDEKSPLDFEWAIQLDNLTN